jgi:hypothetical protein
MIEVAWTTVYLRAIKEEDMVLDILPHDPLPE